MNSKHVPSTVRISIGLSDAQVRWTMVFHGYGRMRDDYLGRPFRLDDFRMANRRLAAYKRLVARHNLA